MNQPEAMYEDTEEAFSAIALVLQKMPLDALVENRYNTKVALEEAKARLDMFDHEILRRAAEKNASVLFTDEDQIEITRTEKTVHRIDVLRKLEKLVPPEVLNKALYLYCPDPEYKVDTVKMKAIAKRYGEEVAEIIADGMPREMVGLPKIRITSRSQQKAA